VVVESEAIDGDRTAEEYQNSVTLVAHDRVGGRILVVAGSLGPLAADLLSGPAMFASAHRGSGVHRAVAIVVAQPRVRARARKRVRAFAEPEGVVRSGWAPVL
jgi:hypothetical protein